MTFDALTIVVTVCCVILISYINADECTNDFTPVSTAQVTTTNCSNTGFGPIYTEIASGECVVSMFGILSVDCNERGFLVYKSDTDYTGYKCQCYSTRHDPNNRCERTSLDSVDLFTTVVASGLTSVKVTCDALNSIRYGCYKAVDSSGHRFGDPDPPIPYACCHDNIGPPPGELTENLFPENLVDVYFECNTVGGIPPEIEVTPINATVPEINRTTAVQETRAFRVCHGHGDWNVTTRTCECHKGWQLAIVGEYPEGTSLYSCVSCSPLYGPDVFDVEAQPPFCSAIYSPNPQTGFLEECGGKGVYRDGHCDCFGNSTHGFWSLVNITIQDVTVESCGLCTADCDL